MPSQDLRAKELFKDDDPKYHNRRDKFLTKLKDPRNKFELSVKGKKLYPSSSSVTIDIKYLPAQANSILSPETVSPNWRTRQKQADELTFIDKNGNMFKLIHFKKTKEFGGGGSSGPTTNTKTVENLQCVYLAAKYQGKNFIDSELETVGNFSGDLPVKKVLELSGKLSNSEAWHKSSIAIAEVIYKSFKGTAPRSYIFRKGDQWVNTLYREAAKLNKKLEGGSVFSQGDKWNPADIWMTIGKPTIPTDKKHLIDFNVWLEEQYNNRKIIGISLKQNTSGRAAWILKNNEGYTPTTYNFTGYTIGKRDYHQSKYNIIYYDGGQNNEEMQLRTVPAFVGEIKGPGYRIGKITYSNQNSPLGKRAMDILKCDPVRGVPDFSTEKSRFNASNQEIRDNIMREFYETYKKIVESPPDDENSMHRKPADSEEEFYEKVEQKAKIDGTYKISKYIGFKIIAAIACATKEQQNRFISSVVQYAKSESELSSIHIVAK